MENSIDNETISFLNKFFDSIDSDEKIPYHKINDFFYILEEAFLENGIDMLPTLLRDTANRWEKLLNNKDKQK